MGKLELGIRNVEGGIGKVECGIWPGLGLTANRRISNIEPQNFEGWFRFAHSFLYNRQNTFLRYSTFDIHDSIFAF